MPKLPRQQQRVGLADMPDAERVDEPLQRPACAPSSMATRRASRRGVPDTPPTRPAGGLPAFRDAAFRAWKMCCGCRDHAGLEEFLDLLGEPALDVERRDAPQSISAARSPAPDTPSPPVQRRSTSSSPSPEPRTASESADTDSASGICRPSHPSGASPRQRARSAE